MKNILLILGLIQSLLFSNEIITPKNIFIQKNHTKKTKESLNYKFYLKKIFTTLDITTFRSSLRPQIAGTNKKYLKDIFSEKELSIKDNQLTIETKSWYYIFTIKNIKNDKMSISFVDDAKYATYLSESNLLINLHHMKVIEEPKDSIDYCSSDYQYTKEIHSIKYIQYIYEKLDFSKFSSIQGQFVKSTNIKYLKDMYPNFKYNSRVLIENKKNKILRVEDDGVLSEYEIIDINKNILTIKMYDKATHGTYEALSILEINMDNGEVKDKSLCYAR